MKEVFELIRKRLESVWRLKVPNGNIRRTFYIPLQDALSIVSEVEAEYGNWHEKQTYEICLNGCDDDTIFKMELTENEYKFLLRVSELANKTSTYGCMPRLYVKKYTPTTD